MRIAHVWACLLFLRGQRHTSHPAHGDPGGGQHNLLTDDHFRLPRIYLNQVTNQTNQKEHLYNTQNKNNIAVEVKFGLNANFFVINPDYGRPGGPPSVKFYQKNFIGSIVGIEMKYGLTKKARLGFAFAKSINKKEVNYSGNINGISLNIIDFHITHSNKFFQLLIILF